MPQCSKTISWLALVSLFIVTGCAQISSEFAGSTVQPEMTGETEEADPLILRGLEILTTLDPLKEAPIAGSTTLGWVLTGSKSSRLRKPLSLGHYDHFLYIVDAGARLVYRYDTRLNSLDALTGIEEVMKGEPGAISVLSDGRFLLVDASGGQVHLFDYDGKWQKTYRSAGNLSKPSAAVFEEVSQRVFVADSVYSHIVVFDASGEALYAMGMRGKAPGFFHRITAMSLIDEEIFVGDALALPIQVLARDGNVKYTFPREDVISPTGIAVDRFGRIFVSDSTDNFIRIFQDRKLIAKFGGGGSKPGKFRNISDLHVVGDVLYAADSLNGRVQRIKIDPPIMGVHIP